MGLQIVIQARMSSTRLRGKVLLPLCGKTVLEVMLDRLAGFRSSIIIATSTDRSDDAIVDLAQKIGVPCVRGSMDDVLARFILALQNTDDIIVRLTADCPLIDPDIVAACVELVKSGGYDYASNCICRTYPRGLDVEAMRAACLFSAHEESIDAFEREHVTPFIYKKPERFRLGSLEDARDNSRYRLTLDENADYEAIKAAYEAFGYRTDFAYEELITMLDSNPHIAQLNAAVAQK